MYVCMYVCTLETKAQWLPNHNFYEITDWKNVARVIKLQNYEGISVDTMRSSRKNNMEVQLKAVNKE